MAKYIIEHTHTITDIYYVEAKSEAEAERMFLDDMIDEPEDSWESDDGEIEVKECDYEEEDWFDEEEEF